MEQAESKPRLIRAKRGAVFALCFTAYVTALSVRDVLWHSQREHHWLLGLDQLLYDLNRLMCWRLSWPAWIVAGISLAFYAGLLWGGVLLYRVSQGKERILVVCGTAVIFLGLIQFLVSPSAATPIDLLKALLAVAAFVAAVDIFLKMPAIGYPRADN